MSSIVTSEQLIKTSIGEIYSKKWKKQNGHRLTFSVPIVLLHDSLGCVELWRDFPQQLCSFTGKDVIAYDRLGFGKSSAYPSNIELDFISDESSGAFTKVIEFYNLNQFILFGHSVGGAMAASCAAHFPDRCQALITEAAQAFVEDLTLNGIRDANFFFKDKKQFDRLSKYHGTKTQWVLDAWIKTWLSDDFRNWNLDDYLPLISCPNLVLHGENDEYGTVKHPHRYGELTSGESNIQILSDCGHIPHKEIPEIILDNILKFLQKI